MTLFSFVETMLPMAALALAFFGLLGRFALIAAVSFFCYSSETIVGWLVALFIGTFAWHSNADTWFPPIKKLFGLDSNSK